MDDDGLIAGSLLVMTEHFGSCCPAMRPGWRLV
jgi:hypothetical protein